ncbi:MAG: dockerin type I repeat-containing protein, partial [Oscillospiraceae bacterium]|nr:dockerin type I repeat-containing protein [Oscillospiraceae bacterium]
ELDGIAVTAYTGEILIDHVKILTKSEISETIMGDVNKDGKFDISDVITFQKWLLAVPDTHLADWKVADFCNDEKLNVFDFCLMKKALING